MNPTHRSSVRIALVSLLLLAGARASRAAEDWLPISPDDLALKDNPKQPGADAMVLYREVNEDAQSATVNNYMRIKVFTDQGVKDQADVELPYDKAEETIGGIRARTIQPDGKIIDFEGKAFDKEIVKGSAIKYLAKTFTMPDVQPGSIIEYMYREQYDDHFYWTLGWTVQYTLFTRLARFSIKPDQSMYALPLRSRSYALPANLASVQRQSNLYTLEIHDLPGVEQEQLMPPPSALEARVEFYYVDSRTHENETPDQYWKRVAKGWNENVDGFVDKKKELAEEVAQDTAPGDAPEVKLRKLYDRTLKIRNLDFEQGKSEKEAKQEQIKPNNNVEDVLKHGYGNSADVNFLMIGLARAAGFESAEVRLAPRTGIYFFPQREAASDLSAEVVWVRANSKEYYLDPASRFYAFNTLPWSEEAANGVRASKDGAQMISTPVPDSSEATVVRRADFNVDNNMEVSGTLQVDFTGQEAASLRTEHRDEDANGRKKVLEDELKPWLPLGATLEITNVANWDDVEQPLHVEATVHVPSIANRVVQRMLFPREMFQTSEVGYFESQKRVNEIDFPFAYERIDDVVLHLPLGFSVLALPDPQTINLGPVSYAITETETPDKSSVEVKRHLVIKGMRYPKESYAGLRNFFSTVRTDDNAQIMLQAGSTAKLN
jgi:Domain of Unknown Function with PDB structure (DUF3857)